MIFVPRPGLRPVVRSLFHRHVPLAQMRRFGFWLAGCNRCSACRARRAAVMTQRGLHEFEAFGPSPNAFATLTYAPEHLPANATLSRRDLQLFVKRLRKSAGVRLSVSAAGEYGSLNLRPHYHLTILGRDFDRDAAAPVEGDFPQFFSRELSALWPFGRCTHGPVTAETVAYVHGYCLKAHDLVDTTTGEVSENPLVGFRDGRVPPFFQGPRDGLGSAWAVDHLEEMFPRDLYSLPDGREFQPPDHYATLCKRHRPDLWDQTLEVRAARREEARVRSLDLLDADPDLSALRAEAVASGAKLSALDSLRTDLRSKV